MVFRRKEPKFQFYSLAGRPTTAESNVNVEQMWNNQRYTVRIIAQELNIIREIFQLILTEN